MERELVEVPPVRFWITRGGSGSPVVLLHGLSGSQAWWSRNVPVLVERHEVASVDLVGFGSNRRFVSGELPLPFDDAASVIGRWISRTFSEPVHLVGHSMGGQIAILIAAAYPEAVRSLALVGSTGIPLRPDLLSRARHALRTPRATVSFGPVVARDFLRAGPTSVALAAARLLRSDAREAMEALDLPALLIWGERDPLVPESYAAQILDLIEGSRLVVVPAAGHVPMWENPDAFNSALEDFLVDVEQEKPGIRQPRRVFQWGIDDIADGIAWRCPGAEPDVILVHGLGIPCAYFQPLARALFKRGVIAMAADQPGVGWSRGDLRDLDAAADAMILAATRFDSPPAVWVGHSTGCQLVERVRQRRPDLVGRAVHLSPIWSDRPHRLERLVSMLPGDGLREHPLLVGYAISSYLRAGLWPIVSAMREWVEHAGAARAPLPESDVIVGGVDDPMLDWTYLEHLAPYAIRRVPGAHGMHFSHPEETATVIAGVVAAQGS